MWLRKLLQVKVYIVLPKFEVESKNDFIYFQYSLSLNIYLTVIKLNFFAKIIFVFVVDKTQNTMEKNGLTTKQMKVLIKYNAMM